MRSRILSYLATGIKPAQVATIVGISPGYISQLLKEDSFVEELNELVLSKPVDGEEKDLDNKYISLEHNILKAVEESLPGAELPALVRALEVVSKRQDMRFARKHPVTIQPNALGTVNAVYVTVSLPSHALPPPTILLNEQKEILAINDKSLAPMSSDSVRGLFASIREKKEQKDLIAAAMLFTPVSVPIKELAMAGADF